jgi:hypothetical protein
VESHAPVAADRRMCHLSIGRAALRIDANLPSVTWRWCALASRRPLEAACQCSVVQRGTPDSSDSWRMSVLAVEAAKQSAPVVMGSGMPSPPLRIGRARIGRSLATSSIVVSRRAGKKTVAMASFRGAKAGKRSGVTLWRYCHSAWSDQDRPA